MRSAARFDAMPRSRTRARKERKNTKRAASRPLRVSKPLMVRMPSEPSSMGRGRSATKTKSAPSDNVPQAMISAAAGPVTVEIAIGHAQHGTYTIQLFDPSGTSELARLTGLSTDDIADRIALKPSPSQLDRHILQWSGAVDAFSPAP